MAVYIDRQKLFAKIDWDNDIKKWTIYDDDLCSIPPADVTPVKHGKWTGHLFDRLSDEEYPILENADYLECSTCKENYYEKTHDFFGYLHTCRPYYDKPNLIPKYCPNCGAKMDLEEQL